MTSMNIENPLAYSFIIQDDIYLLNADKQLFKGSEKPAPEAVVVKETPAPSFKYFGAYKKQYLVLTHYSDAEFMADAHLTALHNTIKRLDYEPGDIAVFNLATYPDAQFQQITDFFNPQKLLILGKGALPHGISAPVQNTPQPVSGISTLFTYGFDEMMDSQENKKAFWEAIKLFK
jgi:hypothetical protein